MTNIRNYSIVIVASLAAITFSAREVAAQGLLGSPMLIGSLTQHDSKSAVAYHNGEDVYCVVWERRFEVDDIEVRARVRTATNGSMGSSIYVTLGSGVLNLNPTVCEIPGTDTFMVAWQSGTSASGPFDIYACTLDSAGTVGPAFLATHDGTLTNGSPANEIHPQLMRSDDGSVLLAYEVPGTGILTRVLTPTSASAASVFASGPMLSNLSVSGSTTTTHCLVWNSRTSGVDVVRARRCDLGGAAIGDPFELPGGSLNFHNPAVDGNGSRFLIVFEREFDPTRHLIQAAIVTWNAQGNAAHNGAFPVLDFSTNDQRYPAVTYMGHECLAMWSESVGSPDYVLNGATYKLENFNGRIDPYFTANGNQDNDTRPALASSRGGSNESGKAFVSWSSSASAPLDDSNVHGQIYEEWGLNAGVEFSSGCGNDLDLEGTGPFAIGNLDFTFRLTSPAPNPQIALFNFGFSSATFSCGCDVVVPDVIEPVLMIGGVADYGVALPCEPALVGTSLAVQAATLVFGVSVGVCPILDELSFSEVETWTFGY